MNLKELQSYDNWIGESPKQVLDSVRNVGGWKKVFPGPLPVWAHKVRNYFNQEPLVLTRLGSDHALELLKRIRATLRVVQDSRLRAGMKAVGDAYLVLHMKYAVGENGALYRYVYKDNNRNFWYQMDAGSTIYHFGDEPGSAAVGEAIYFSKWKEQRFTPVFKLVSLDGTGGSMETIIKNDQNRNVGSVMGFEFKGGRYSIAEAGTVLQVAHLIERGPRHQGSYNYSETVDVGLDNHEKRDVDTHKKYKSRGAYVDPPNRFAQLSTRFFPATDKGGLPLAMQI